MPINNLDSSKNDLTVVVTRLNEDDSVVLECMASLSKQNNAIIEVLFLDQNKSLQIKKILSEYSRQTILNI
jgi:cellulose synthase/poly-beta-1,6-N-acetylglucosamine synthase-like glycosyltransferase